MPAPPAADADEDALRALARSELRRVFEETLHPGVLRLHLDPDEAGLRVRLRWSDGRLEELAPVPPSVAPSLAKALHRGYPLPAGFQTSSQQESPAAWDAVRRRLERGDRGERQALRMVVTPVVGGHAVCLTRLASPSASTAPDPRGHLREGTTQRADIEEAAREPGGFLVALGLTAQDAHDAATELLELADPTQEQVTYQIGPAELPLAPGAARVETIHSTYGWSHEDQLRWALELGPDRVVADAGVTCDALGTLARGALGGVQVIAAASMRRAGLELATWGGPGRSSECLRVALRGVLHAASLPRLCEGCRRPGGDAPEPGPRRGRPGYRRGGCAACRGHGVLGRVRLRAWTPADTRLLQALGPEPDLEVRADRMAAATAEASGDMLDQLGVALREGWVEASAAAAVRRRLEATP